MKIAAFACAVALVLSAAVPAWANCHSCPSGQTYSHEKGACVVSSVSS